jgi:hypothetical protein
LVIAAIAIFHSRVRSSVQPPPGKKPEMIRAYVEMKAQGAPPH